MGPNSNEIIWSLLCPKIPESSLGTNITYTEQIGYFKIEFMGIDEVFLHLAQYLV
jgi:hypothetical protein